MMKKNLIQSVVNRLNYYSKYFFYKRINKKILDFYLKNYEDKNNLETNKIVNKLIKNIPFYKKYKNFELNKLPITEKKDHQTGLIRNKLSIIKAKYNMNTGGSTGKPLQFFVSTQAGIIDTYHQIAQHKKMGFQSGDKLYVFNGCDIPVDKLNKNIFWKNKKNKKEMPFGSKEFSSHYLNSENLPFYLNELMYAPPQYIRSYPSIFLDFTKLLLSINYLFPPFKLKGVQLTSEILNDNDKIFLEKYWGKIIYLQYGHSEAATIASQFPGEDFYTFSPYYGYVEILDKDGNHVTEGKTGRIIVTSFHNSVEPFIRYDTGDLAIFRSRKNELVTVHKIVGRSQDFVFDKNKNKISVTGLVFGQHFLAFANILKWQIVNVDFGKLVVKIVKLNSFTNNDLTEIKNKLSFKGRFNVEVIFVNEISKTSRGKHQLVLNNLVNK